MQMERERNGNGGDYCYSHRKHQKVDHVTPDGMMWKPLSLSPARPSTPPLPPSCSPVRDGVGGGMSYIEHRVSKMDTLAGVAIKYGVEVADIKRINGLVTDLQMFALKTLHIPLPGRHPPSPSLSNGFDSQGPSSSEKTPCRDGCSDLFESFQSLKLKSSPQRRVSSAMSELQGFYGLKGGKKTAAEGFEMAVYRQGGSRYLEDGPLLPQSSPLSNPPLSLHRKSRSVANGFWLENSEPADDVSVAGVKEGDSDNWNEKLTRRRQKSVADFSSHTPEMLLKEDNSNSSSGGFSAIGGKGLANRSKAANRTASGVDGEACLLHPVPTGLGDSLVVDIFSGVRKSSSTPSLQDQENGTSSSNRPTSRWSLKPDLPISSAAITKPMFDGLPNPITGRRNKAALD